MTDLLRRTVLIAAAGTLAGHSAHSQAQSGYPNRPIKIVVPFPAGGGTDIIARPLAVFLSKDLGTPVLIENKAGASGMIGTAQVAHAAPDGYTLLLTVGSPIIINPNVFTKVAYDPLSDLSAIAQISTMPIALAVAKSAPYDNLNEFVAFAKKQSVPLSFGSTGLGSASHIIGQSVGRKLGVELNHVPFQGSAQALSALLGGHISAVFADMAAVMSQLEGGRIKVLAVTGDRPAQALPSVATFAEQGLSGMRLSWLAVLSPAGVAPETAEKVSQSIARAVESKGLQEVILRGGMDPAYSSPRAMNQKVREDFAYWRNLVKEIGGVTVE